jgi:hypothetical protein
MQKINDICLQISNLTDAELEEVERESRKQISYVHPLKFATAKRINDTGRHNLSVLRNLRRLRNCIKKK